MVIHTHPTSFGGRVFFISKSIVFYIKMTLRLYGDYINMSHNRKWDTKITQTVYIPDDIRAYWEAHGGRENMLLFLRYAPLIFTKYMSAEPDLLIFLEDKPELKQLLEETI